ncbi:MAG: FkbM family methyltransferase [Actinomycetes bacterium]
MSAEVVARASFRLRLWWQLSVRRRLARLAIVRHLPWRVWCLLAAWNAEATVAEIGRRSARPLTYLQIGANDGVSNDPLYATARARGWSGVLVEPMPHLFERLTTMYGGDAKVRLANVAIADEPGTVTMYAVDRRPDDPEWVDQIASLRRDVIMRHAYALADLDERIVTQEVESMPLGDLVRRHALSIVDLMHIDAEGFDSEVIRQIDLHAPWAPRFLIFELKHIGRPAWAQTQARLRAAGYRFVSLWPDELAYREAP